MSHSLPDFSESLLRERVARILSGALRAPSAENCQPFRFGWDGRELAVFHDEERARHRLNHDDSVSLLALGGLLSALETAATVEKMTAHVRLGVDDGARSWARVHLAPAEVSPAEEAAAQAELQAIQQRATDRRLYRGGSFSHPVFEQLRRKAAAWTNCRLHLLAQPGAELVRYLVQADSRLLRHPDAVADVLRWVRFSDEEVDATRDGVPWRSFGLDLPALPAPELLRRPSSWHRLRAIGLERVTSVWLRRQLASSAALCAISVQPGSREQLVAAGRLAFEAWTLLNREGFGVQPLTHPAISVYSLAQGALLPGTSPDFISLFQQGRGVLARAFGWSRTELPVWLMRIGVSPPLPPRMRTLRLPASSVLTFQEPGP